MKPILSYPILSYPILLVAALCILLTAGCSLVEFNDFSVSGRVIDASGNPISGVKVTLQEKGQTLSVTTYSTGSYEFKNLGMGVKNLTYFHNSYKTQTRSVEAKYYYEEKVADVVLERITEPDPEVDPLEALAESMVFVEGGTFQMGATSEQGSDAYDNEKPVHSVTLSDFYIGKYEVTQAQWKAVMGENPSYNNGDDNLPIEHVSWEEVQEFIQKLNARTGKRYRLPTEAEWEYAARGGNQSQGYKYAGSHTTDEVAWYAENRSGRTHPVGQKQPNELGLYDMSGNVYEWCEDWYGSYDSSAQTNPTGPSSGSTRVLRGGSWNSSDWYCRVAYRDSFNPSNRIGDHGFRLVEGELPPQEDPEVDPLEALAESMVFVEGGTFQMGATSEQGSDAYDSEKPVHSVTLSDFYMGKYEVTQAQWKAVMGENPSSFTGDDNLPVEQVSWEDVQEFIQKLNAKTGKTYRLPTEAEWEYAARGGNQSQGYKYAGSNTLEELAWYDGNSNLQTHPVGKKQPNELGLYDMSGNVYEWCQDCYGAYSSSSQTNPTGPAGGLQRVLRGSSWGDSARSCRVSHRHCDYPSNRYEYYGFRLVEGELPPQEDPEVDPLEALAESMVFVEGGTFQMGATSEQGSDAYADEKPVHSVTLSDFYMGKYEVTQAQWKAVMGENPSYFTGDDNRPVERVSWEDVQEFIQKLNALTGKTYRLPTEAEWEYAARGGNQSQGYKYAGSNLIDMVAWYDPNSDHKTHPVGQKQPNELGLYDMSGNVSEWCQDWYYGSYDSSAQTNPTGPSSGASRVLRGGSCYAIAEACRVASRHDLFPSYGNIHYGFRLVEGELPPQEDPKPDPVLEALAESMVFVEGGTFQMGATDEQGSDVDADEKPVHSVTLSDFYIGKYEVTQEQWKAVMGSNLSYFTGDDNLPVEQVSWDEIQEFIEKLNQLTGKTYRLPTEAEWEYAARGGNQSQGYKYAGSNAIDEVAWYAENSGDKTHPVGQKQPNELGLYDMTGNVYEWCQDWDGSYDSSAQTNPTGPSRGSARVLRGNCWCSYARYCRVSERSCADPSISDSTIGFRLVEGELPQQEDPEPDPEVDPLEALAESMVFVEGGTFQMGATSEQGSDAYDNEKPVHSVTLSDFYIGKYEVTQAQWKAVMGENPSSFTGDDNLPVEEVSWKDVQEFIQKLNAKTGKTYRLPTEAEWEYAARGGSHSQGYKYSGSDTLDEVAWYANNSGSKTHPVGQKQPNELGLYDMSGNVYEWCQDWWYGGYPSSAQTNPTGPASGSSRVFRGGSYYGSARICRVAYRYGNIPSNSYDHLGFRLVEGELPPQEDPLEALAESMVFVEGGTFQMGATSEQGTDAQEYEKPVHSVTLSDFYIGKYEVTEAQWEAVMGYNFTGDDNRPMESVSWEDVQEFIQKLNTLTGKTYRLPTEAEWEYAARGGNQSQGYKYAGSNTIEEVAWYALNSSGQTHLVGQKQPNELGLYDMSGNVYEWCQDWYGSYDSSAQTNPTGPSSGSYRVLRGVVMTSMRGSAG